MSANLPLVAPHSREHTYCAFCPKLCRFACPVSTVQASETTTPWGKMTSLHHVVAGNLPMDPDYAQTWYACTGCMRCKTFCEHGTDVASALDAARAEAVKTSKAPASAYDVIERHPERERHAVQRAHELFGDRMTRDGDEVFVPGCTACVLAPEDALASLHAVEALCGGRVRVEAASCCGLPLLEAGDPDGFLRAAGALLERLRGSKRVIFQDPGCLHALAKHAPRLGLTHDIDMIHLTQLAAASLGRLTRIAVEGPVRYHDPCKLGRGMDIYDQPRRVLAGILGRPPGELDQHRDRSECCGAGGQLPRTDGEAAAAIARERIADHELVGGGLLVTACPACRRALSAQGATTADLGALIARSLGAAE